MEIKIISQPKSHAGTALYVAGNFNGWNPKDENSIIQKLPDGSFSFLLPNNISGNIEFKITRGSWDLVETDVHGNDISNRIMSASSNNIYPIEIKGWKDDFNSNGKQHTASANVHILDTAFQLPGLDARRVWIYLPPNYSSTQKRFPVLYMHDGQNLFDAATSGFGEWGVDEIMDSIYTKTGQSWIVIGIDNDTKRMEEYDPYDQPKYGKELGKEYVISLVNSLKPFVDGHYRTLTDKKHTAIAGSSMGGIISMWAVMQYPNVFGAAGIFSPAFWVAPQFKTDIKTMMKGYDGKLFFYCGGSESETMVSDMDDVIANVKQVCNAKIIRKVVMSGQHNEASWHKELPKFFVKIL